MIFNMRKNKILFVFEHCEYDDNKILTIKNFSYRIIFYSHYSFCLLKKSNEKLRFYVDYKKLNVIIKKNRYFILLINGIFDKNIRL